MTLVEILVAIAIFAVVMAISSGITSSLSTNRLSQERLMVNQAAQEYFEVVTEVWRNTARFGVLDTAVSPPRAIPGYTWSLRVCEVDVDSATFACKAAQTVTWTSTSQPGLTPTTNATLMNLSLTYTPASGSGFVNGTEIYRR